MHKALKNCLLIGVVFVLFFTSFTVLAQTPTSSAEKLKEGSGAPPQSPPSPPVPNKEQIKDLTGAAGLTNTNQNPSVTGDPFLRFEQSEKKVSVLEKSMQTLTNVVFGIVLILIVLFGAVIFLFIKTYRKK